MLLEKITNEMLWVIIAILALNLFQRKHQQRSQKKRVATITIASLVLLLNILFVVILQFKLPQWLAFPALLVPIAVGYLLRKRIAIFKRKCASCGTKLDMNSMLYFDDNLCPECHKEQYPEQYTKPEPEPEATETPELLPSSARDVDEIDWELWEPTETAVVCYVFSGKEVLLIHKKTGLGNGLINAPGGRIEIAETAVEAAVRETAEETGITPVAPRQVGVLNFQFVDGYALRGYVFFADQHTGEMVETAEAAPFWAEVDRLPYDSMWEDDRYWLPLALEGKQVTGYFIFDDRKMLSKKIESSD